MVIRLNQRFLKNLQTIDIARNMICTNVHITIHRKNAMNNNSDPMYKKYNDEDFTEAKGVSEVPALKQLQAEASGKPRITMRVDNDVLAAFKEKAATSGGSYQTMMNEALKQFLQGETLADVVRTTIRKELHQ